MKHNNLANRINALNTKIAGADWRFLKQIMLKVRFGWYRIKRLSNAERNSQQMITFWGFNSYPHKYITAPLQIH
ncbi:hypothetical protein QJ48_20955 [Paenibacillus sp. A3]|nr:hypothetical protein QJ48_20955 [Paenibacillus sp. A3]